jgi:hypothetical protein
MVEMDKEETTFIFKWGAYAYNVMLFGLIQCPYNLSKGSNQGF